MKFMTGSDAVVQSLIAEKIDLVFGIPGYHTEHLYGRLMQQDKVRHILARHEQGAGFMAIGVARVTGRPATVFSTAGPGALNAATPMGEAYGDSVPLLNIMAEDISQYLYQDRGIVHESQDQFGVFSRLSQWSKQASQPADIPVAIHEGLRRMQVNRPRPVVVEIPVDVFAAEGDVKIESAETHDRPAGDAGEIERAARMLAEAERPLIWAGGGVISSGAWGELQSLAERLDAPVITTCSGKGSIPENHPLCIGNLATQGPVKRLMAESDAMLAVGARFGYLPTAKWSIPVPRRLIHIDIDATQPGKNFPVEVGIHADARLGLQSLIDVLGGHKSDCGEWVSAANRARQAVWDEMQRRAPGELAILRTLRETLPSETIITADPHLLGYWGRSFLPVYEPRTWLHDLAFGTLGYAFPVALGARIAAPDKPVVALTGDGGFLFTSQELATAVQLGINVVTVIFNDNAYGAIKEDFLRDFGKAYEVDLVNPDFVKYAESFGAVGLRTSPEGLGETLKKALALGRPCLIDVPVRAKRPLVMD